MRSRAHQTAGKEPGYASRLLRLVIAAAACLLLVLLAGCGGVSPAAVSTRAESGLDFDSAIKVGSIGEELDVMNGTACGGSGFFRKTHVEVVARSGKHYDMIDVACTAGNETRKFYFDVSSCFPCPD